MDDASRPTGGLQRRLNPTGFALEIDDPYELTSARASDREGERLDASRRSTPTRPAPAVGRPARPRLGDDGPVSPRLADGRQVDRHGAWARADAGRGGRLRPGGRLTEDRRAADEPRCGGAPGDALPRRDRRRRCRTGHGRDPSFERRPPGGRRHRQRRRRTRRRGRYRRAAPPGVRARPRQHRGGRAPRHLAQGSARHPARARDAARSTARRGGRACGPPGPRQRPAARARRSGCSGERRGTVPAGRTRTRAQGPWAAPDRAIPTTWSHYLRSRSARPAPAGHRGRLLRPADSRPPWTGSSSARPSG